MSANRGKIEGSKAMLWNMPAAESHKGEKTAQETMQGWPVREDRARGCMEMKRWGHLKQGAMCSIKPHDGSSDNSQGFDIGFSKTEITDDLDKENLLRRWRQSLDGVSLRRERRKEERKMETTGISNKTKCQKHFPPLPQHAVNKVRSTC